MLKGSGGKAASSFIKMSKKGSIVSVCKEHYLRDDIPCGFEICHLCLGKNDKCNLPLPPTMAYKSDFSIHPHFLIPDSNIFLHQMDVLEQCSDFAFLIILQTVWDEVKHRHPKQHNRLKLLMESRKHFYLFSNEHHKDTYVTRLAGETPNDRNDRAIRVAAAWYQTHLQHLHIDSVNIVLLTDDTANRLKAETENFLLASSLQNYLQHMHPASKYAMFLDMVYVQSENNLHASNNSSNDQESVQGSIHFEPHLSRETCLDGIARGKFYRSTLFTSIYNVYEGSAII